MVPELPIWPSSIHRYNGTSSRRENITCGVPQGSILGPLLFLIYVNDLANASKVVFSLLFADDTNMFLSGLDPDQLVKMMNQEMKFVVDWLWLNKLSLNFTKTQFILFRIKKKGQKVSLSEKLVIDNIKINMVNITKVLGVCTYRPDSYI